MVSSRGKSKGCLATFAERKTRMYLAVKMDNRSSSYGFVGYFISKLHSFLLANGSNIMWICEKGV